MAFSVISKKNSQNFPITARNDQLIPCYMNKMKIHINTTDFIYYVPKTHTNIYFRVKYDKKKYFYMKIRVAPGIYTCTKLNEVINKKCEDELKQLCKKKFIEYPEGFIFLKFKFNKYGLDLQLAEGMIVVNCDKDESLLNYYNIFRDIKDSNAFQINRRQFCNFKFIIFDQQINLQCYGDTQFSQFGTLIQHEDCGKYIFNYNFDLLIHYYYIYQIRLFTYDHEEVTCNYGNPFNVIIVNYGKIGNILCKDCHEHFSF
jgi:hypothetical protein